MKTHEIKRYPTRKMYDSLEGRYVTLEDVSAFVQRYEQVRVSDSKTGEDITVQVLLQVVGEQNNKGKSPLLTEQTLLNLIRLNQSPAALYWSQMIEKALSAFAMQMQETTAQTGGLDLSKFDPFGLWDTGRDRKKP